jgi:ribosomal protein L7/L12
MPKVYVDADDLNTVLNITANNCSFSDATWPAFRRLMRAADRGAKEILPWQLDNVGDRKIEVIKVWRRWTGWGLRESKDAVEETPTALPVEDVVNGDVDEFVKELKAAGAMVTR